jgi:hypothetical protein
MGTSVSHPSPTTNPWQAVRAAYSNEAVGLDRVAQLIWRAAGLSSHAALGSQLAGAEIAACARAVAAGTSASTLETIARLGARSEQPGLATEIARRAALNSLPGTNRALTFTENLFREATRYLIARDAPSLVSESGRLRTVRDVVQLKTAVADKVADLVRRQTPPKSLDADAWGSFVQGIVRELAK